MIFGKLKKWSFGHALLVVAFALAFLSVSESVSAQTSHKNFTKKNAYTGKSAWWLNYQFFPALEQIGLSDDTLPDLKHRLSFHLGGGYGGMRFRDDFVDYSMKGGGQIGARYSLFLNKYFGFRTGLDFSFSTSNAHADYFEDYYTKIDEENDELRYDYSIDEVDEKYRLYLFQLPVQMVGKFGNFTTGLGLKFAIPVLAYDQTLSGITNTGYYPAYDVLVDDSWVIAAGYYKNLASEHSYTRCQVIFIATADVEYDIKLNDKLSLGIGAYFDYSTSPLSARGRHITDAASAGEALLSTTNKVPVQFEGKSMVSAMKENESNEVVYDIRYFSAGLKVSLNINWYGDPKPRFKPY